MKLSNEAIDVFTLCHVKATEIFGDNVYHTSLPVDDVPYPFAYIAYQDTTPRLTKLGKVSTTVNQTIRLYHDNLDQRGTFYNKIQSLAESLEGNKLVNDSLIRLTDYQIVINPEDSGTGNKLLHGRLELTFITSTGGKNK